MPLKAGCVACVRTRALACLGEGREVPAPWTQPAILVDAVMWTSSSITASLVCGQGLSSGSVGFDFQHCWSFCATWSHALLTSLGGGVGDFRLF